MLGLRLLLDGVTPESFFRRHGVPLRDQFGHEIRRLQQQGLLDPGADRIRLTDRGAMLANSVCAEFLDR
jgi:coproporphyrinogen III oxidase-like Fe-S oxidoreductase